jgi:uncharacterized membrane protein
MLNIMTKFYPIRILAHMRNEVELNINVENNGHQPYWLEADVILPSGVLSLAPDKELLNGRMRGGIVFPNESRIIRCKIYANSGAYPDTYRIKIAAYAYDKEGVIAKREDTTAELRCERVSQPPR